MLGSLFSLLISRAMNECLICVCIIRMLVGVLKHSNPCGLSKAKLKAASQEEQIHTWKEHFQNLHGKSPKVTDKPITKIINNQKDIKLG